MAEYSGRAILVAPDGSEHVVGVELRERRADLTEPRSWDGTIEGDRRVLVAARASSFSSTLRMLDGRSGPALLTHVDDEVDADGVTWATIVGAGEAPFGRP